MSARSSGAVVAALAVAAAAGAAFAGCRPTGAVVIDGLYAAAFAAGVTLAASRSNRWAVLFLAAVGFAFSRSWLWIPASAALVVAFGSCLPRRRNVVASAASGAIAVQVVLRWPTVGFHGFTALVAAAAVLPVLVSAWYTAGRRGRRVGLVVAGGVMVFGVVASVPVLLSALSARSHVQYGIATAKSSIDDVESANASSARQDLGTASADLGQAHHTLSGWWNLGGYLVPVVAQQERAMSEGVDAGDHLVSTAARVSGQIDFNQLRYTDGQIDLAAIERMQQPAADVDRSVASAQADLRRVDSQWLVGPLSSRIESMASQLAAVRPRVDLAASATKEAPALLGASGPRHYFVAFMTPAETRGLGGFIGAYGILTVDNGQIHLTASGRPIALSGPQSPPRRLDAPASYLARYGAFAPQDNLEDVTYAPDLPTVDDVISNLYPEIAGTKIDGVLVLDPYGLAAMLQLTGPITVPGLGELTSANAADVLLRQQYLVGSITNDARHDYLQDALSSGIHKLAAGSLPSPQTLGEVLGPEIRQGRLLFWSNHPAEQPLLSQLGLEGAFPDRDGGDLLAVTVANAGNNKIDAYLHQRVTDAVRYDQASGKVSSTVTIDMDNAAPASGMPDYVIGSFSGSGLPRGTNYMWLSLYTPLRVEAASVGGKPVKLSGPVTEDGVNVYSVYLEIPAASTARVVVSLSGEVAAGGYRMTTRLQPLANPNAFSVSLSSSVPEQNAGLVSAGTWVAGSDEVQRHEWAPQITGGVQR